jgi:hypothetical protein
MTPARNTRPLLPSCPRTSTVHLMSHVGTGGPQKGCLNLASCRLRHHSLPPCPSETCNMAHMPAALLHPGSINQPGRAPQMDAALWHKVLILVLHVDRCAVNGVPRHSTSPDVALAARCLHWLIASIVPLDATATLSGSHRHSTP